MCEEQQYPIGRFEWKGATAAERERAIDRIAALPAKLRTVTRDFDEDAWETPYREGGWTAQQVVAHIADSHMNAYIRIKLALSAEWPRVNAYDQDAWAQMNDSLVTPAEVSLKLIEALHTRLSNLLSSLSEADFEKGFEHSENGRMTLDKTVALYAWHGDHHLAHVTNLAKKLGL